MKTFMIILNAHLIKISDNKKKSTLFIFLFSKFLQNSFRGVKILTKDNYPNKNKVLSLVSSRMGVRTKEWSQAQRNLVINLFKQGKTFRLIQEATEMALGTISDLIKR